MRIRSPLLLSMILAAGGCGSDPAGVDRDDRPGALLVTVEVKGSTVNGSSRVLVDGVERARLEGDGFVTIADVPPGPHDVAVQAPDASCRIVPAASRSVTVRAGLTETVSFTLDCRPTGFDRIVFESDRAGNWEIFTMNPDGSDPQRVTVDASFDFWPELAPDGAAIAWTAHRDGGNSGEIYVANVDGTDVRNLTRHPANDYLPAWSPDGSAIAFVSDRDGSLDIWIVDVETLAVQQVTDVSAADLEPDWTPDGKSLVYSSFRSGDGQHVFIQRIGDPNATQLTFGNLVLEEGPEVSPDGTMIAYRRYNVAPEGIHRVGIAGGATTPLTANFETNPSWSPDGSRIAYGRSGDIHVMDESGSGSVNITQSDWNDRRPHWGPSDPTRPAAR